MTGPDLGHIAGPVVIPNCVRVELKWTTPNGRTALNVLHGSVGGGFTPTASIANALLSGLTTGGTFGTLAVLLSTATELAGVSLLDMRSANNAAVDSTGTAAPGTSGADPLSPATALVITERTAKAGPGFRGRIYIPGWTNDAVGLLAAASTSAVGALQNWADTFIGVFAAEGLTLSLAQPARAAYTGTSGTAHAARAAHLEPITQMVVRNGFWDNQRRRGGRT